MQQASDWQWEVEAGKDESQKQRQGGWRLLWFRGNVLGLLVFDFRGSVLGFLVLVA